MQMTHGPVCRLDSSTKYMWNSKLVVSTLIFNCRKLRKVALLSGLFENSVHQVVATMFHPYTIKLFQELNDDPDLRLQF